MSDVVISVENLSKCYLVGHEGPQERYHSLRDTMVRHGRNYARKAMDMACGRQIIQGDSVEEFWALKDVSFEVRRGEVLGIIGRNGAGKSTLLKVLSRITEPTSGRVVLEGRVASLLEVGTGFHPELSGRENIFLNGAILGMTRAEIRSKFDEIVDFAGVEKFLDTPVKRYSSGMYVRLAFAVAAHLEPELLIVDEVLAVGDASFQEKCIAQMRKFASSGRTIIFVSHNMGAVLSLCHRGVLLDAGSIIASGSTEEVISSYFSKNQEIDPAGTMKQQNGVELVAIRINGKESSEVSDIPFAMPFELCLRFKSMRSYEEARIQLTIYNSVETKIAMISSREMGPGSFDLQGEVEIFVEVAKNALVPDKYRIDLQLKGPPELPILYHLPNLWQFSISDRVLPGAWGPYTKENGVLYLESRIDCKPMKTDQGQ